MNAQEARNSPQQQIPVVFIGEMPKADKIFQATGAMSQDYELYLKLQKSKDFSAQTPYNNKTERKEEETMPENDALHITNKRIDDAISQTRDIVERGIAENKALFNSLDAKISGLIEEQKDMRDEIRSIRDSQKQQSYFMVGTVLSIVGIGIAVYIGLAQIAVSVTQIAKPPESQPANVYVLPQQQNPEIKN